MPFFTFFNFVMPSVSTTAYDIFTDAQPWFDQMWPVVKWALVLGAVGWIIGMIISWFRGGTKQN